MTFNNKFLNISIHFLFWVILLLVTFTGESLQYSEEIPWSMLSQFIFAFAIMAAVSYVNTLVLIPRFFKTKRYFLYALLLVLALNLGAGLALIFRNAFFRMGLEIPHYWTFGKDHSLNYFLHILFSEFLVILLTSFFYMLQKLIKLHSVTIRLKEIESEKNQAQLQSLKAQINPHFLFNTLNNIYSHSLTHSPKTPEMILKLSDLMSYMLYECDEEKVFISNELAFIKNYVDLEKLRYEEQIEIELVISETHKGNKIAPLLFIPFIENAFKHGGSIGQNKRFVRISIEVETGYVALYVANSTDEDNSENYVAKEKGIGIENIRKRLELLYKDSYTLQFSHKSGIFSAELKILRYGD